MPDCTHHARRMSARCAPAPGRHSGASTRGLERRAHLTATVTAMWSDVTARLQIMLARSRHSWTLTDADGGRTWIYGADASVVRLRPAPVGRAPPAAAGRSRPIRDFWSDGPRRSLGCQWSPTFSCVRCRALKPNGPGGRLGHAELPHHPRLDQVLDRSRHFFDHLSRGRSCIRSTSAGVSSAKQCG
jgi:hypothetical protein